ncbi:hypothetical protein BKA82DRAFT_4326878 [Pisolithus tinctorius]|nr:hypothetical protein BKA82DRAFT_4326878 [Pisolithus tinctorius]
MHHGLIPCSPITPKVAITVQALDLYHTVCQRCPHLSIQGYVKLLCNIHGVPFHNHHSHQFSIVLNIYLQILALISNLVHQALQCNQPDWRLKHGCPSCTYELQDKPTMQFKMLFAQDRNDSLKRVVTRVLDDNLNDASPLTPSHPMLEGVFHHEQYLTCDFVKKFASRQQTGHSIIAEDGDGNLCVEHWKNMKDSATQKMWSIFDETGVFIAVCQHGFCLLIADMVQSDEHHAHSRLCQLENLTTYIEGLGLEDLEGCERAFSKSNALVLRQAIACYFEHNDKLEVYANLTKFLLNNYKQALDLLSNGHLTLKQLMHELGVSDPDTFKLWLDEEHEYLGSLLCKPVEEMLQMEYWQRLSILSTWTVIMANNAASPRSDSSATRKVETMRHHAQENYEKDLKAVQELEGHLKITCRWVLEDEEWQAAACCHTPKVFFPHFDSHRLVTNQKYQWALDKLSKMNQSGTGYKLRKHIGKALQTCSAAIQAALSQYNAAAKEVVEYTFLADFDLLRDTQKDISTHPWVSPTACLAINMYFKLCWAEEEVVCLNVEICCVVTYLIDEDRYLQACEALYQDTNPALAYQISRYHAIRS